MDELTRDVFGDYVSIYDFQQSIEIEDVLENLPRAYSDDLFRTKCGALFEHVYEAYAGDGRSVFSAAA